MAVENMIDMIFFMIFSEWFIVHSSKISHVDDTGGMKCIFTVLMQLFFVNYVCLLISVNN